MITIRNAQTGARALTVRAGEDLILGQPVKVVKGSAVGAPPQVVKCTAADLKDATLFKGIVGFVVDNVDAVTWTYNLDTYDLALNEGPDNTFKIPKDSQCVIWYDMPQFGFHSAAVDDSLDFATIREGETKVAFVAATGKLCLYDDTAEDTGAETYMGFVYRHDGAEITVQFTEF